MRVFKALLFNQIISFKCNYKRFLMFITLYFISTLVFCFKASGFSMLDSIIFFILCVYGASAVGCSSIDIVFEKEENMLKYIFSQGINKWILILSKLITPVILSVVASILPVIISLIKYQVLNVNFILMETITICSAILWSLLVLITDMLINNDILKNFSNAISPLVIIIGLLLFTYNKPTWVFYTVVVTIIAILSCLCYVILTSKEVKIRFKYVE